MVSENHPLVETTQEVLTVQPWQVHSRLDTLLREFYKTSSRSYFQQLIKDGLVLVNGLRPKKSYKPAADDEIEVQLVLTKELQLIPEDIPLNILFEDEELLAINKPAGMVVHPGHGNNSGTFANALLFYCKTLERADSLRPGIVHRIDKETTGVLLAAKTIRMHQALAELFAKREVEKRYIAICLGTPKEPRGRLVSSIGRHPVHRKQMAVVQEGGKEAITNYSVRASKSGLSIVDLSIETGRTHQIRVHLKHLGYPILGDTLYGRDTANKQYNTYRQQLHCHYLSFIHPLTKKPLELVAPLPEDMMKYMELTSCEPSFSV